ncbi:molybdenum cofactor biosynthesis protein MoaE [Marinobacterium sp. LSUCC0821]|jgi:molybdopterin synthase catalytic subunit|uniref:molybdenum cofactor biosynthesis protein MoaE n=1 Tax=Marinobacterium sp. LSUCC0821 TaxID=2668067 RepID=UPI0014511D50|nr:molybdenum cofactor biosynthesis protein MoaE [Marinobacterium sp. LSUCC0821]QJD70869.1 molybdenum cofactor biosynthesis protein MoaE [Marinobacterium sp. LSUCC0821]
MQDHIEVVEQAFDSAAGLQWLKEDSQGVGALVSFTGMVRELPDADLDFMELEHYPGMTEKALQKITAQARERWPLKRVFIVHRVGAMRLSDEVVQVAVSSAHRAAAFEAASFIMDYLKRDAPFWKREVSDKGSVWVEQKSSDVAAAERWSDDA